MGLGRPARSEIKGLTIEYLWNDTHGVEVRVSADNGVFAASADAYVNHGWLEMFAEKIKGFPKHSFDVREEQFGETSSLQSGIILSGIYLKFRADAFGRVVVDASIKSNENDVEQSANLFFWAEASAVDHFVRELHGVARAKAGVAALPDSARI